MLDANVVRQTPVIEACLDAFRNRGAQVVLPEMVLFELTKHPEKWEQTVAGSLRLLAACPQAVLVAHSVKTLGLAEEKSGVPTVEIINPKMTEALRHLLSDLHHGDGPDLDYFRWAVPRVREMLGHEKYAEDSRQSMQTLKKIAKASFPREDIALVGNDLAKDDRTSFRGVLMSALRLDEQRNAHVRRGVAEHAADALRQAPSISYLFALGFGALGLEWVFRGGIENAAPERVANDILDLEYGIAGMWVGRLVSEDRRARSRFEDLKVIGTSCWPGQTEWFERAKALAPADIT